MLVKALDLAANEGLIEPEQAAVLVQGVKFGERIIITDENINIM